MKLTRRAFLKSLGFMAATVGLSIPFLDTPLPLEEATYDWKTYYPSIEIIVDPDCPPDMFYFLNNKFITAQKSIKEELEDQLWRAYT